jgi:hypothetical protein
VAEPASGWREAPSAEREEGDRKSRSRSVRRDGEAYGPEVVSVTRQEKPLSEDPQTPVPQTDTGRGVEYTKANGRTLVKELGKMAA